MPNKLKHNGYYPLSYNPGNRISELDSIKGLAAFLVVLFHLPCWNISFYEIRFIRNGYLIVNLFFVLSGFVIYKSYAEKINSFKGLLEFQFLRFSRLYPVHILFLVVFIFIEIAKYLALITLGINSANSTPFKSNNFVALIQQIFLIQAIGATGNARTFNQPDWYISVLFYTYLLFGLIVLYANRYKIIIFSFTAFISVILLTNQSFPAFNDLLSCFAGFFFGCITAKLCEKTNIRLYSYSALISLVSLSYFLTIKTNPKYDSIIYFLSSILVMTIVLSDKGIFRKILNWEFLIWLGAISYSVYMSHYAIEWISSQAVRVLLKKPEIRIAGLICPQLSELETGIVYAFIILFVLIISQIIYKKVETPFRQILRSFVS